MHSEIKPMSKLEQNGQLIEEISCSSAEALAALVQRCNKEGRKLLAAKAQKLPVSPAQRLSYFLNFDECQKIIDHSRPDLVMSVETGITLKALQDYLRTQKQWFPVYLADSNISLMEFINNGDAGALEHAFGEARDLILGMQLVLGSGEIIKCGGKVVKNVSGYDLSKLFCGSKGSLAIPTTAHLRLFALPDEQCTLLIGFKQIDEAFKFANELCASALPLSCLEIVKESLLADSSFSPKELGGQSAVLVCVQLHGMPSVLSELERELSELPSLRVGQKEKLEATEAEKFWQFISSPRHFRNELSCIELAAATRSLQELCKELAETFPELSYTARPARNKAKIFFPEKIKQEQVIDLIRSIISRSKSKVILALADESFLYKVLSLPEEDLVLNELKHRIKREYDPNSVLNPLVSI
ncbi:MAG: FAD-binding oxidoreductase [Candidatus Obscuribacterales bacterium]|nr:FAD-binding oxidoreductase [Candidatus Obscuribacterales bacterium]